jgi:hypothetical protein
MGQDETKQTGQSVFQRVLFLIRRKYYGKANYPEQRADLIITPENFKRSQKGTTVLLIDSDLFIRLSPTTSGKEVSDDTKLFHNLVFVENINVLRSMRMKFEYDPARRFFPFLKWLYERGLKFSDYYLARGGYFRKYFLVLLAAILVVFAAIALLPFHFVLGLLSVLCCIYIFACIWLSETLLDFPILLIGMPAILFVFGAGVLSYWLKKTLQSGSAEKNGAGGLT